MAALALLTIAAPVWSQDKPAPAAGEARYYAVLMDGKKIGRAKHLRSVADGVVTTEETVQWTMGRLGQTMSLLMVTASRETVKGEPLGFEYTQQINTQTSRYVGQRGDDGRFRVVKEAGGARGEEVIAWPANAVMSEGARLLARAKGLKEGTRYEYSLFSPATLSVMETKVAVGAKKEVDLLGRIVELTETRAVTAASTLLGKTSVETVSYVNEDFEELKAVQPMLGMNLEVVACSRQFAVSPNDVVEFFNKLVLTSPKPLKDLAKAKSVRYVLKAAGDQKVVIPATDEQTVAAEADGRIVVTVRPAKAPAGGAFPYTGKDKDLLAAMARTRYLQSDDERVIALAKKAVGDAKTAAEAVGRIERFVREYVSKKDLSVGYATAAEVAVSRQGDCTEHAVLAAAMCRAAGIPAQVVTGLGYVPRIGSKTDCFGPHAWARAWVGEGTPGRNVPRPGDPGRWIGLDAALSGYDAGHITLSFGDGGPEDYFGLVGTLGCFEIVDVTIENAADR